MRRNADANAPRSAGVPRVRPYKDYLAWLAGQDRAAAESAWREALDGVDEPTLVAPADPARAPLRPSVHRLELSAADTAALQKKLSLELGTKVTIRHSGENGEQDGDA